MKEPINKNYCAVVMEIKNHVELEGCDNVVGTTIFGSQAIISKGTPIGTKGIFFPAETQLSHEFCKANNLYRHSDMNQNSDKKGYMEDNRRVKAMKFRGHKSNALFMKLESLKFTGYDISKLEIGMEFDELNDVKICKKYLIREPGVQNKLSGQKKKAWVELKHMPEHFDTDNFWRNIDKVGRFSKMVLTQKLHGTSIRVGHTLTNRKLSFLEKVVQFFGANIQEKEYNYVYASRKVIKDQDENNHFYDTDIWTEQGKKLVGLLPKNYIIYGELIGWTPDGKEIQRNYTYNVPHGESHLYIYRVAFVNEDGVVQDLSWEDVKVFCKERGLNVVPGIPINIEEREKVVKNNCSTESIIEFVNFYMDKRFSEMQYPTEDGELSVPLSNEDTVDEGVCIRFEGYRSQPYILKAKSPKFLEHETKLLDTNQEDLESTQA